MKFGFRVPSLKKRLSARFSWKRYIRHSLGVKMPRGFGFFTNPKKALYNKFYRKTTIGIEDIGILGEKYKNNLSIPSNNNIFKSNVLRANDSGKIIKSTSKALTVTGQNFIDLREEINEIFQLKNELLKKLQNTKVKFYTLTFLHVLSYPLIFGLFCKKIDEIRTIKKMEIKNLKIKLSSTFVKLTFADQSQFEKSWLNCVGTFTEVMKSEKIWDLTFSESINTVKERTTAKTAFKRTIIHASQREIEFIKSDLPHIFISNANGPDLFIFPTFLILYKNHQDLGIFDLKEVNAILEFSNFIEEEDVPKDTEIISHTWKKANKDGSMDKRFKENYQIPIVRYGSLTFQSENVLEEGYMFSNFNAFSTFQEAYSYHISLLLK